MFCSNSFNIYVSRVFYQIPLNALHATFYGKRNKARPRLCWIDSINKDIAPLGLALSRAMNRYLTNDRCLTNNQRQWFHLFVPIATNWLVSGTDEDDL